MLAILPSRTVRRRRDRETAAACRLIAGLVFTTLQVG
jgi:hypothetical protein